MGKRRRSRASESWWTDSTGGMPHWGLVASVAFLAVLGVVVGISVANQPQRAVAGDEVAPIPTFSFGAPRTQSPVPEIAVPARLVDVDFAALDSLPTETSDGRPFLIWDNGRNATGLAVEDGLLRHGEPTEANAAGYVEIPIGKPVDVLGADVVFQPGDNVGQIALVVWESSLTESPIPPAGIHFVASAGKWHVSSWENGETVYGEGTYEAPTVDGVTPQTFQLVRQGDVLWVQLPDGSTAGPFQNPLIAERAAEWASWELYEFSDTVTPATFSRIWAG